MEIVDNTNAHSIPGLESDINDAPSTTDVYTGEKPIAPLDSSAEPPFSVYEQIKGVPYSIIHFDLNSELFNDKAALRDGATMKMARDIDAFVSSEIERKQLIDSVNTYVDIISELKSMLGINSLERNDSVLKKLHLFIKRYHGVSAYKI